MPARISLYIWVRLSLCAACIAASATVSYGAVPAGDSFPDSLRHFTRPAGATRPPPIDADGAIRRAPGRATAAVSETPCVDWTTVEEGTPPILWTVVVLDTRRERLITVEGPENAVWEQSLSGEAGWRPLATVGGPGAGGPTLYDPVRDRVVVFREGTTEVWELALAGTPTWSLLNTANAPQIPDAVGLGYDPVRNRAILFGGTVYDESDGEVILTTTYTFSLTTHAWGGLPPCPAAYGQRGYYDAGRDRLVVEGGRNRESPQPTYTLTLSGTPRWQYLADDSPGTSFGSLYDPLRERLLVYSAQYGVWELPMADSAPEWTLVPAGNASPHHQWGTSAVYDAPRDRMIIVDGTETWALALAGPVAWSQIEDPFHRPSLRAACAAIYDAPRHRMVVFGGEGWADPAMSDVRALGLDGQPGWSLLAQEGAGPRGRADASVIFDPVRERMVVFGGRESTNNHLLDDAWSLPLAAAPLWNQISPTGTPPGKRSSHTAIYDPVRDRMVVFGGYDLTLAYHNDVFALDLAGDPVWRWLRPLGTPPTARVEHCAVYDPVRDRMLVIGGYDRETGFLSSVWALSLAGTGQWSQLTTIGAPPPTRDATAVYDAAGDRVLLFGGTSGSPELYALDLAGQPTWSLLSTNTPQPARSGHAAIFDPENERMVIFGGATGGAYQNDVRAVAEIANSEHLLVSVEPAGTGVIARDPSQVCYVTGANVTLTAVPSLGRAFAGWGGDAAGSENPLTIAMTGEKRVVAYFIGFPVAAQASPGGSVSRAPNQSTYVPGSAVTLTATPAAGYGFIGWSGDATGKSNPLTVTVDRALSITANFARYEVVVAPAPASAGAVTRSPDQTTYVPGTPVTLRARPRPGYDFAGWSGDASGPLNPITLVVDEQKSVVANFQAIPATCGGWSALSVSGPTARWLAATVWDPVRERVILFGGYGVPGFMNDLWTFTPATSTWSPLIASGTRPGPRDAVAAAYDPARDAVLFYGGNNGSFLNDAYLLSLGGAEGPAWSPFAMGNPPEPRFAVSLVCDAARDRFLLFGGLAAASETHSLWELEFSTGSAVWRPLDLPGPPAARHGHAAIYDPTRDRMLILGGTRPSPGPAFSDVWSLELAGTPVWRELHPAGGPPPARSQASAALDAARDRLIVYGGQNGLVFPDDMWALSLSPGPAWSNLSPYSGAPPVPRSAAGFTFDPMRGQVVMFGGYNPGQGAMGDTWRLGVSQGHALDLAIDAPERGAVVRSPNRGCYSPGEVVTLTAVPAPDYAFVGWSADAEGTESPLAVTMNGHKSIVARFDLATTAALLAQFEATRSGRGIELRWRFGAPERVSGVTLERAPAEVGPWAALAVAVREEGGAFVALDETAEPGREHFYRLVATLRDGAPTTFGPISARAAGWIAASAITSVAPNPSVGATQIQFALARAGAVRLTVADVAGRRVTTLVDGEQAAGPYTVAWDGTAQGGRVPPGMYFVHLVTADHAVAHRLVLVR